MNKSKLTLSSKLLVMLMMVSLLLTSCSLLPSTVTDTIDQAISQTTDEVTISREEYDRLKNYEELDQLLKIAQANFYQDFDEADLIESAERGLLYGLDDPYTFYYSPEEFAAMWEDDEGEYAGIGILIQASYITNLCTVMRVFTNSPALEAGILKNDILVKVEDIEVTAVNLQDAVDIMRGEEGTTVHIQVLRDGELKEFDVPRAHIKVNWVNSMMLDEQTGYIAVYEFAGDCSVEFTSQLNELINKGAKCLILDLRDNPGGWVNDAVNMADTFLPECVITYLQDKQGRKQYYTAKEGELDIPLVILVNENSASASEIFAAAMKDYEKATIVGVNTYGKGIVQNVIPFGTKGAGLQITIAQYFTPKGNEVHKIGVAPDVVCELTEGDNGMYDFGDTNDPQLQKAIEVMKEKMQTNP